LPPVTYSLSLHDALPTWDRSEIQMDLMRAKVFHLITKLDLGGAQKVTLMTLERLPRDRYELGLVASPEGLLETRPDRVRTGLAGDRKSTRLNSSHVAISY